MSRYFSRLASRTGLLNQAQHATTGTVAGLPKSHKTSQQNLEVRTEYSTAGIPAAKLSKTEDAADSRKSGRTATMPEEAGQPVSPQHPENSMTLSFAEKSSGPAASPLAGQHAVENHPSQSEAWSPAGAPTQASDASGPSTAPLPVASTPHERIEKTRGKPVTGPDNAGISAFSAMAVEREINQSEPHPEFGKRDFHMAASTEKRVAPKREIFDSDELNMATGLPEADDHPGEVVLNNSKRRGPITEPVLKAVKPAQTAEVSRTDSNAHPQHGSIEAPQKGNEQPRQQIQVNIQSIALEVHQSEPVQQPVPVTAARKSAPGPAQASPSHTRLSRYYLKGW